MKNTNSDSSKVYSDAERIKAFKSDLSELLAKHDVILRTGVTVVEKGELPAQWLPNITAKFASKYDYALMTVIRPSLTVDLGNRI